MELYIITLILINIGSLRMVHFLKKKENDNELLSKWEINALVVSSLFGGAFGVVLGMLALDFRKEDKKLLLTIVMFLILNVIVLKQFIGG